MKSWIKKYLPTPTSIKKRWGKGKLKKWFHNNPDLWKFTKHSVAAGIAVSLFVAFLPLPFEILIVTLFAILFRANLPISLLSVWITNPFTLIPANYFSYKVGEFILRTNGEFTPIPKFEFDWNNWTSTVTQFINWLTALGKPYLLGLPLVSISSALITYFIVYFIWTGVELLKKRKK